MPDGGRVRVVFALLAVPVLLAAGWAVPASHAGAVVASSPVAGGRDAPPTTPVYYETFNETGLPWNVVWSVNVNGSEWSVGTRSDIRVPLPNGTYSYALTNQWGRQVRSPSASGTFVVAGPIDHVVDPKIPVGPDPYSVAYDPANGYLYVANKGSSNLTVIDGATNQVVIASISVTNEPYALAYDPQNNEIFVASAGSNEVDVIDATTNEVVAYIGVGAQPEGIAYDPSTGDIYVANSQSDNLTVIDGLTNAVLDPSIPTGLHPFAIAFDPQGGIAYVANQGGSNLTVLGPPGYSGPRSVPVGNGPSALAYDPANGDLYVANYYSDNLTVINATSAEVTTPGVAVGSYPFSLVVDPVSDYLYVADEQNDNVSVINGATNARVGPDFRVGASPTSLAYDPANGFVYVVDSTNDSVAAINANGYVATVWALSPTYPISFSESGLPAGNTWSVTVNGTTVSGPAGTNLHVREPNGTFPYSVNGGFGFQSLYPAASGAVTVRGLPDSVVVPNIGPVVGPSALAYDPALNAVIVTDSSAGTVTVINATTSAPIETVGVGIGPAAVAYDPTNGEVYVANSGSDNVTVLGGDPLRVLVPSIGVGLTPSAIAFDPSSTEMFVAVRNNSDVVVINASTNERTGAPIPVGTGPVAIAYDPANNDLFVADSVGGNVTVIDGATDRVSETLAVGAEPSALAYDPLDGSIYVADHGTGAVSEIGPTGKVTTILVQGASAAPSAVAFDPTNGFLYIANAGNDSALVLNGSTGAKVGATIGVGLGPSALAYVPVNAYVYVANEHSDNLTAIYGALSVIATDWEVAPFYGVTFSERGLAPNTNWTVSVAGFSSSSVAGTNVTVTLPNGTYTFRATTRNPIYIGVDATVTVRGGADAGPHCRLRALHRSGDVRREWAAYRTEMVGPCIGRAGHERHDPRDHHLRGQRQLRLLDVGPGLRRLERYVPRRRRARDEDRRVQSGRDSVVGLRPDRDRADRRRDPRARDLAAPAPKSRGSRVRSAPVPPGRTVTDALPARRFDRSKARFSDPLALVQIRRLDHTTVREARNRGT